MWREVMDVIIANSVWSRVIKAQPANTNYLLSAIYIIYIYLLLKLNVVSVQTPLQFYLYLIYTLQ